MAALVCSLSPERTIGAFTFVRPSALLYAIVPMFRSYARFGVVVQLMAALLAGIGVDYLRRAGTRRARIVCLVLVALAVGEYAVAPSALWRDVLPTAAHRWIMRQPGHVRAFDCTPLTQESASVQWLTGHRVTLLDSSTSDCTEPNLSQKLAATGYTHLLVRRDTADGQWFADTRRLDGLRVAARFDDGEVFDSHGASAGDLYRGDDGVLSARARRGVVVAMDGSRRGVDGCEHQHPADRRLPRAGDLGVSPCAPRGVACSTDGMCRRSPSIHLVACYQIGPLTIGPGSHELVFHPAEAARTAANDVIRQVTGARCRLRRHLELDRSGVSESVDATVRVSGFLGRRRRALSRPRGGRLHALLLGQRATAVHRALSPARGIEDSQDRSLG